MGFASALIVMNVFSPIFDAICESVLHIYRHKGALLDSFKKQPVLPGKPKKEEPVVRVIEKTEIPAEETEVSEETVPEAKISAEEPAIEIDVQVRKNSHGLLDSVGDIVELQIQEDLMTTGLDLLDNAGAFCIIQLHADLQEGLAVTSCELVQECKGCLRRGKITCYNYVLTHYFAPPIISLKLLIRYLAMTAGRSRTISRQM